MKRFALFAAVASMGATVSQPCLAAEDFRDIHNVERRSGAFAGAAVKMHLGRSERTAPTARLQIGIAHSFRSATSAVPMRVVQASALELGMENRRPSLFIGGKSTAALKKRMNINGSTETTFLVVGGIALAAVAGYLLFLDDDNDTVPLSGN